MATKQDTTSVEVLFRMRVHVNDVDDPEDLAGARIADTVIEGMTSVDMTNAIGECLASWYLSLQDEDVEVSALDAIEVVPAKDRRRNLAFHFSRNGGILQDN